MGRFSKLETGQRAPQAPKAEPAAEGESRVRSGFDVKEERYDLGTCLARGDEAVFADEPQEALIWYGRGMKLDQTQIEPWIGQIRLLLLRGELREAKVWLSRGKAIFPRSPALETLGALLTARMGMVQQALNVSDKVLAHHGENVAAWVARGNILLISGNRNAEFCFQQAMEQSNDADWQTPMWIGLALKSERKYARAIQYLEMALRRNPTLPHGWYQTALCHARLGHREAAHEALGRADELCSDRDDRLRRKIVTTGTGSFFGRIRSLFGKG